MKSISSSLATALALGALAASGSAQISTICTETFDTYTIGNTVQGQGGGQFWFNTWWSDPNDKVVAGLNGTTAALQIGQPDSGAYRIPKSGPWTDTAAPGFQFGGDGTVLWISFWAQRNGDAEYAGVLLNEQFVGEKVFLGTPYQSGLWGIVDSIGGSGNATVAGSNIDVPSHLVYKIEYLPGQELVSLWVNPGTAHPTSAADATKMVGDHKWNEIGIKAGTGSVVDWKFTFDEITVECDNCTPPNIKGDISSMSVSAGGTQNITCQAGVQFENYLYLLVGTISGTTPGFTIPFVGTLPINFDAYTSYTLLNPNTYPLGNSFGTLNLDGNSFPTFTLNPLSNPGLVGKQANHAYAVFNPFSAEIELLSDAQPCDLVL